MKTTVNFTSFKNALDKVEKLSIKSKALPIIENLHIKVKGNSLYLSKFDLETKIEAIVYSDIQEEGDMIIPVSTLKIIKNIKSGIWVTLTDEEISIDKKIIKFIQLPVSDYPKSLVTPNIKKFEVSEKELLRLLTCSYATATNETRPILTGINIHNNDFVGLDGFIMSVRHSNEFTSDLNIVISKNTFTLLNKTLDKKSIKKVNVYVSEKEIEVYNKKSIEQDCIRFEFDNVNIEGRLLQGEYMRYEQIIPDLSDATTVLTITDKELQDKLKLFNALDNGLNVVTMNIANDIMNISSSDAENKIEDEIIGDIKGNDLLIGFDNKLLIKTTSQHNEFKMYMTSKVSPAIITENNEDLELLLPVRIN